MKNLILVSLTLFLSSQCYSQTTILYYGTALCSHPDYECITSKGQSWKKMFPDDHHRDIVQRVNRTYNYPWRGKKLAVPKNLDSTTILDVSPFPLSITKEGEKTIIIDQDKLAWGAYDIDGKLVKWGPISSGKDYCPDINRSCNTQTGVFRIFNKQDSRCRSRAFPVGEGGAKMPYCMFFYKGFAMHGSFDMPGKRDSHGCVRLFTRDAKWLNEKFVQLSTRENNLQGTKVIIQKLTYFGYQPERRGR
jgi:L,D-transpeptidase catalytic domain